MVLLFPIFLCKLCPLESVLLPRVSERPESEVASPTTRPTTAENHGIVSINVDVLLSTISTIVAQAVQSALFQNNMQATLTSGRSIKQDVAVEQAVKRETSAIVTSNAETEGLQPIIENSDPKPTQVFTSLAVRPSFQS